MKYDLIIFDLDGTLLNTLEDLAASARFALGKYGFPARSNDDIRRFIGNGVKQLIFRAVPEGTPEEVCQRVLADYREYYTRNVNVHTRPYPGVTDMLKALRDAGLRCAVNSNKPDNAVRLLCQAHFDGMLDMVLGERSGIPKKPDPQGARLIMDALGAAKDRTLYVGDGEADLMTARNAGTDGAWVSWGFRRRDELGGLDIPRSFDSVDQVTDYILG